MTQERTNPPETVPTELDPSYGNSLAESNEPVSSSTVMDSFPEPRGWALRWDGRAIVDLNSRQKK